MPMEGRAEVLSIGVSMGSGGHLLVSADVLLDTIDILGSGVHGWQQLRGILPSDGALDDLEQFPDDRGGRVDFLEAFGRAGTQPGGGKGRLHHVRGPQMAPMFARKLIEGDQPVPVMGERLHGFRSQLAVACGERGPQPLARVLALRIGDGAEQGAFLGLLFVRDGIQHVGDPMMPAALLRGRRLLLGQGGPKAQMPIRDGTAPGLQLYHLQVVQSSLFARVIFRLPAGLQPRQRGGRERSPLTQQPPQCQLEIAQG